MDALGLTERQRDAMLFVQGFIDRHGFSPTYDEIAAALGLKSKSGIHRLVYGLVERGYLRMPESGRPLKRAVTIRTRIA